MKKIMMMAMFVASLMLLGSCASREERVINKINRLAERVEENSNKMDVEEITEIVEDLADIHEEMEDCDFTSEQLREIGKADGKIVAVLARGAASELGSKALKYLGGAASIASGALEGLNSNIPTREVEEAGEQVMSSLEKLKELAD